MNALDMGYRDPLLEEQKSRGAEEPMAACRSFICSSAPLLFCSSLGQALLLGHENRVRHRIGPEVQPDPIAVHPHDPRTHRERRRRTEPNGSLEARAELGRLEPRREGEEE